MAAFELKKSEAGAFHINLLGENGKTIVRSEQYSSKASAQNGIESVRKNAENEARYELKEGSTGKFYFNLKAANGQIVGTSMMYATEADRAAAIAELKKGAAKAGVVES